MVEFESWLTEKLTNLGTDAGVFSPYIVGILESEETEEEKEEGIDSLLSDILTDENVIQTVKEEIRVHWSKFINKPEETNAKSEHEVEDICEQMHRIMEQKNQSFTSQKKEQTEEEKKLKQAILASYAQVEDEEDNEDGEGEGDDTDLGAINNAEAVAKAQQEWRESQKAAAIAKKEKDKQDREQQKKQAEDRKKKAQEKTAKGERRSGR